MKNLPLALMYVLVFGLFVYSCNKENNEVELAYELTSPDGMILAKSTADLETMMMKYLSPIYGKNLEFEITRIDYLVQEGVGTDADVSYRFKGEGEKNIMFFWTAEQIRKATQGGGEDMATLIPVPAPGPLCTGDCNPFSPCRTQKHIPTSTYFCKCSDESGNIFLGSDCVMTIPTDPGGGGYSCPGTCGTDPWVNNGTMCQPSYNNTTGILECVCNQTANAECGTVTEVPAPNPFEVENL